LISEITSPTSDIKLSVNNYALKALKRQKDCRLPNSGHRQP